MSSFASLLESQLSAPVSSPQLDFIRHLKAAHPQSQHASILYNIGSTPFPLSAYLDTVGIKPEIIEPDTHSVLRYNEEKRDTYAQAVAGITDFVHESVRFRVYKASWSHNWQQYEFYHFVFDGADNSAGTKLVNAVYTWGQELKEEIWVFEGGQWEKSKQLYKAVRVASWDEVVLDSEFKDGLRRDTKTFFESKEAYASLGITWKRGILLLGPPGNGKTESIKALLHETKDVAPLYVKSFTTCNGPEEGVRAIFDHARAHTPCILILEDLDAMLVPEVRSLFLNELDGLADNEGILTIATTNHPEHIDDAILSRPSRFDVKYEFALPNPELRKEFAIKWLAKVNVLAANTGVKFNEPEETASAVVDKTEGWSYAFLKELFVSFLLRVAHDKSLRQMGVDVPTESAELVLLKQVDQLATQILKTKEAASEEADSKGAAALKALSIQANAKKAMQNIMRGSSGGFVSSGVNF